MEKSDDGWGWYISEEILDKEYNPCEIPELMNEEPGIYNLSELIQDVRPRHAPSCINFDQAEANENTNMETRIHHSASNPEDELYEFNVKDLFIEGSKQTLPTERGEVFVPKVINNVKNVITKGIKRINSSISIPGYIKYPFVLTLVNFALVEKGPMLSRPGC
eukprot:snap_masked-scaffold_12-processed-gene-8.43-mRNA-1 protein AED:1.00 eAED:1.00 QI:0/-1/0/0/-1/1/1/0/162